MTFLERCAAIEGVAVGESAFTDGPALWIGKRDWIEFELAKETDDDDAFAARGRCGRRELAHREARTPAHGRGARPSPPLPLKNRHPAARAVTTLFGTAMTA